MQPSAPSELSEVVREISKVTRIARTNDLNFGSVIGYPESDMSWFSVPPEKYKASSSIRQKPPFELIIIHKSSYHSRLLVCVYSNGVK